MIEKKRVWEKSVHGRITLKSTKQIITTVCKDKLVHDVQNLCNQGPKIKGWLT